MCIYDNDARDREAYFSPPDRPIPRFPTRVWETLDIFGYANIRVIALRSPGTGRSSKDRWMRRFFITPVIFLLPAFPVYHPIQPFFLAERENLSIVPRSLIVRGLAF